MKKTPKAEKSKLEGKIAFPVKQRISSFSEPLKYSIASEGAINLTKSKAYEWLELKSFEGERAVREHHVQFLYDEWAAGRFLWHNVNLASAKLGADTFRINGQHTCWMRVNIPDNKEPIDTDGCVMREYKVESEEQLRNLYSAFDRGAPRSVGHISSVLLMHTEAGRDIPHSYYSRLVPGFKMFFAEDWHSANANPNDLTGLINKSYATLFNTVGQFVRLHWEDAPYCRRAAVIGAMFATFEKSVGKSIEFWEPVWTNVGHETREDPRWKLRQFIDTRKQVNRKGLSGPTVGPEDLYRCCILAYNHWRDGEPVGTIRTTDTRRKVKV